MRRGFQRIFIFIGIMAALGLCGCGKKEIPVREVDPEDIKVLREFFVYDGIGFYADGLKWSDSWEDVKESRGIENADVLNEFTINDIMEGYRVKSDLWDEVPGCDAQESYSFSVGNRLSDVVVTVSISTEEAARTLLNEIFPWVKQNFPEEYYSSDLLEQELDTAIETLINLDDGNIESMTWNAEDCSQFNIEIRGFDNTGYMEITLIIRTPELSSSTVRRSIADVDRFQ